MSLLRKILSGFGFTAPRSQPPSVVLGHSDLHTEVLNDAPPCSETNIDDMKERKRNQSESDQEEKSLRRSKRRRRRRWRSDEQFMDDADYEVIIDLDDELLDSVETSSGSIPPGHGSTDYTTASSIIDDTDEDCFTIEYPPLPSGPDFDSSDENDDAANSEHATQLPAYSLPKLDTSEVSDATTLTYILDDFTFQRMKVRFKPGISPWSGKAKSSALKQHSEFSVNELIAMLPQESTTQCQSEREVNRFVLIVSGTLQIVPSSSKTDSKTDIELLNHTAQLRFHQGTFYVRLIDCTLHVPHMEDSYVFFGDSAASHRDEWIPLGTPNKDYTPWWKPWANQAEFLERVITFLDSHLPQALPADFYVSNILARMYPFELTIFQDIRSYVKKLLPPPGKSTINDSINSPTILISLLQHYIPFLSQLPIFEKYQYHWIFDLTDSVHGKGTPSTLLRRMNIVGWKTWHCFKDVYGPWIRCYRNLADAPDADELDLSYTPSASGESECGCTSSSYHQRCSGTLLSPTPSLSSTMVERDSAESIQSTPPCILPTDIETLKSNIQPGTFVELEHEKGKGIWIAMVTHVSNDYGLRVCNFYTPAQTKLRDAGKLLDDAARVIFASRECQCVRGWVQWEHVIRIVNVCWGRPLVNMGFKTTGRSMGSEKAAAALRKEGGEGNDGYEFWVWGEYHPEQCEFVDIKGGESGFWQFGGAKGTDVWRACGCVDRQMLIDWVGDEGYAAMLKGLKGSKKKINRYLQATATHSELMDSPPTPTSHPAELSEDQHRELLLKAHHIHKRILTPLWPGAFALLNLFQYEDKDIESGVLHPGDEVCEIIEWDVKKKQAIVRAFRASRKEGARVNELEYAGGKRIVRLEGWLEMAKVRGAGDDIWVEGVKADGKLKGGLQYNGAGGRFFFRDLPKKLRKYFPPPPSEAQKQLQMQENFCGSGNFSSGFEDAGGVKTICAVDSCADSVNSYNCRAVLNGREENAHCIDVNDFTLQQLLKPSPTMHPDVLIASPPCQDYSRMNHVPKPRGRSLITAVGAGVEFHKPMYMFMENVAEAGRPRKWEEESEDSTPLDRLIALLINLSYQVRWGIVHAAHYGSPQARNRLIVIAAKSCFTLPELPTPTHLSKVPAANVYIGFHKDPCVDKRQHAFNELSSAPCRRVTIFDTIGHLPLPLEYGVTNREFPHHVLSRRKPEVFSEDNRLDAHGLFPTITTTKVQSKPGTKNKFIHYVQNRSLTVYESALAQGFEPQEVACLHGSLTSIAKQIGNSVPKQLSFALGTELVRARRKDLGFRWSRPVVPLDVTGVRLLNLEEIMEEQVDSVNTVSKTEPAAALKTRCTSTVKEEGGEYDFYIDWDDFDDW
ncbi:uroporphyrin-III C-methyltransferase [Chytridiales sp. JEL 0842]|nr:uroporphyrin-III C-methyltransferase [Chytridiales sp. JEL 0842]